MTADLLRRAAVRAQELADGATPGPWSPYEGDAGDGIQSLSVDDELVVHPGGYDGMFGASIKPADAALIAACDPPFLRAVGEWLAASYADWLRSEQSLGAMSVRAMSGEANEPDPPALAVARALLGESEEVSR